MSEVAADKDRCTVRLIRIGDAIAVRAVGEIDLSTAPLFGDALRRAMEQRQATSITVDLTDVSFIDARGLRALNAARTLARERNYPLRIRCNRHVRRLIEWVAARSSSNDSPQPRSSLNF